MTQSDSTQSEVESQRSFELSEPPPDLGRDPLTLFSRIAMLDSVSTYRQSAPSVELSAVFCPTIRGAGGPIPGIFLGKQVAEATGAQLRIIRSGKAIRRALPGFVIPETSQSTLVIDLDRSYHSPLPALATDTHPLAKHRHTDTALKRNLSLLISLQVGDEAVLNADDDIMTRPGSTTYPSSDLNQKELRLEDALADLAHHPDRHVIGWLIRDQNDHSVVHHVLADLGHESNAIIGSGAQVIRCSPELPFHPNVYNEDLLFLLPLLLNDVRRGPFGSAAVIGVLHQQHSQRYDCERAQAEELGDVLIEGLLWLVERHPDDVLALAMTRPFWVDFLFHRQNQITDALRENRGTARSTRELDNVARRRDAVLRSALSVHSTMKKVAKTLARYVRLWQSDLCQWSEYVAKMRPLFGDRLSMAAALERLRLTDHAQLIRPKGPVQRQLHPMARCG